MNATLIKQEAEGIKNDYVRAILLGATKKDSPLAHITEQAVWNIAKYIRELEEKVKKAGTV